VLYRPMLFIAYRMGVPMVHRHTAHTDTEQDHESKRASYFIKKIDFYFYFYEFCFDGRFLIPDFS